MSNQYYSEGWWKASPKIRLDMAWQRLLIAKALLEEARARLQEYGKFPVADSYRPIADPRQEGLKFIDDFQRQLVYRDYLDAFAAYLLAKMAHDRLTRELVGKDRQAEENPQQRPTTSPRGSPPGESRGPAGQNPETRPHVDEPEEDSTRIVVEPTKQGVKRALEEAVNLQLYGKDEEADEWWAAAGQAAQEILEESLAKLRQELTEGNVKVVLSDLANVQSLGRNDEAAWQDLGAAADTLLEEADKKFRSNPTTQNYKKKLEKRVLCQCLGQKEEEDRMARAVRLKPPGPYKVRQGDTLSKLAKEWYDDPSLWEVIYEENLTVIHDDPNLILPNVTLMMP